MTRSRLWRSLAGAAACALLAAGWLLFAPRQLGGSVTYVTTVGSSMEPHLEAGDLVVVRASDSYDVGEVVAYRSKTVDTTVLHRIIDRDDGRFVLQGDNNSFLDPDRPLPEHVIGQEWLRVPGAGRVVAWAFNPLHGGLVAGLGLLVASTIGSRRRRRRRRNDAVVRKPRPGTASVARAAASLRAPLIVAAAAVIAVGAVAYSRPLTTSGPVTYRHTGQFDYDAPAPDSPAYQDDRVNAGDPVFLRLVSAVDVTFAYALRADQARDASGRASLAVELASSTGWRRTVDIGTAQKFTNDHVTIAGRLDVARMQAMIDDAETATGVTGGAYTLTIVPTVELGATISGTAIDDTFSPRLQFQLDRLQLRPAAPAGANSSSDDAAFRADEAHTLNIPHARASRLTALGRTIDVDDARQMVLLALPALLIAVLAAAVVSRRAAPTAGAVLPPNHQRNLVKVGSFHQAADRTTVDLASIDALTHLAERYDHAILLIARRDGGSDYIIENDRTVYRYRTGPRPSDHGGLPHSQPPRPRLVPDPTEDPAAQSHRAVDRHLAATLIKLLRVRHGA